MKLFLARTLPVVFLANAAWGATLAPPIPPVPAEPESHTVPDSASRNSSEGAPLLLGQGEQRMIRVEDIKKYSLGGTAAHVHLVGSDQVLIKGVSPGLCDLWIWHSGGDSEHRSIRVERSVGSEIKPSLERALGGLQEVDVLISGSGVILRGEVRTQGEAARINALVRGWPSDVHDESEISEPLLASAQTKLDQWLQKSGNSSRLRVERINGTLWVRGSIEKPNEKASAEKQVRNIFPLIETDIDALPDSAPTVHFRVFLLELKKSRFHSIGLGWPPNQAGAFRVTTSSIQDMLQLDVAINALEGEGSAKILSNPELVVRAPGEAELFAGGEIPIQQTSAYFANVTWKTYGLSLKLKVTNTTADKVRLDIFTEVSHLDPSISPDSKIPGLQANRMKTQVDARYGVPLLLSGLLQQSSHEDARGLPFLRQLPILGSLFGSEDYQNERSELVAILLPSSSPPPAPLGKILHYAPKGLLPPPREWISPQDEKRLRSSNEYPWNALQ